MNLIKYLIKKFHRERNISLGVIWKSCLRRVVCSITYNVELNMLVNEV